MRGLVGAVVLLMACTAPAPTAVPTPTPTREPGTLSVTVLLDLSGARTPSGAAQRNAIQLWLDRRTANATPRVRAKFVDVAGSDARTILELRRAAVGDGADAVIVGTPVDYDEPLARAVEVARLPVLFTTPIAEPVAGPTGRWAFALAPTRAALAEAVVTDAIRRATLVPTLLVSDETSAAIAERNALLAELDRRASLHPTVVAVTGQDAATRVRPGFAAARSAFFAGAPQPYVSAIRSAATSARVPLTYLSYLTETSDLTDLREAASFVTWPGSRGSSATSTLTVPYRAAFVRAYTDRHGAPSSLAATAYDAIDIVATAAQRGPVSRDSLRDAIEATAIDGVAARYTFGAERHAGSSSDDLVLLRWDGSRPVLASPPVQNPTP